MRIIQVCPWFQPHVGGVESHVAELSSELVRRGHDVTVVTSRTGRALPEREEWRHIANPFAQTPARWIPAPPASPAKAVAPPSDAGDVDAHPPSPPPVFTPPHGPLC